MKSLILIILVAGISFGFELKVDQTECITDMNVCSSSDQCCSGHCTPPCQSPNVCLQYCKLKSACNGNCPDNSCKTCICPLQQNLVDIQQFCGNSSWNPSCCKCIIGRTSKGNAYYQKSGKTQAAVGVLPIDSLNADMNCKMGIDQFCDWKQNKLCAQKLYHLGQRFVWNDDAKSCGC